MSTQKCLYINVLSSITRNNQKVETTLNAHELMNTQINYIHTWNNIKL